MRHAAILAALWFLTPLPAAAGARISYVRTLPAPRNLGPAEHLAVVYTLGDTETISVFLEAFTVQIQRSGTLRIDDATEAGQHLFAERPDEATIRHIRREHPADVYVGIRRFTCETRPGSGEGSIRNADGERVKRRHVWVDAICRARIDIIDGKTATRRFYFDVSGEGTSPRVSAVTDEEREIAVGQAARYAAVSAAEAITPRRVRESIELDENAPAYDAALPLIDAERLADLRSLWETELRRHARSSALHYNLAAVCEALADLQCARDHYREAERQTPGEKRFRQGSEMFRRRYAISDPSRRVE